MVADCLHEEPNLSYVKVNQNSSLVESVPAGSVPGPSESVKCHIIKTMLQTDPQVVNAGLLHKSMVEQEEPIPKPSVPLWTPVHLYAGGEKHLLRYTRVEWKEINHEEPTTKAQSSNVWQSVPSCVKSRRKRRFEETTTELKKRSLEHENIELKIQIKELETRIELMSKIMRDPNKLSHLVTHLRELRRPCGNTVTRV